MNEVCVKSCKVVVYFANSLDLSILLDRNHQYHIHARIILCAQSALKATKGTWCYWRRFDARIGRETTPLNAAARTAHENKYKSCHILGIENDVSVSQNIYVYIYIPLSNS